MRFAGRDVPLVRILDCMVELQTLLEMRQALPLSFSSDGRHLLVGSTAPGTQQLFAVPVEGGEMQQLTDYDEPVGRKVLPDGQLWWGSTRAATSARSSTSTVSRSSSDPSVHPPHGARGGAVLLAYTTRRRNGIDFDVVVRDLASGEERTIEIGGGVAVAAISPGGRPSSRSASETEAATRISVFARAEAGAFRRTWRRTTSREVPHAGVAPRLLAWATSAGRATMAILRRQARRCRHVEIECAADPPGSICWC